MHLEDSGYGPLPFPLRLGLSLWLNNSYSFTWIAGANYVFAFVKEASAFALGHMNDHEFWAASIMYEYQLRVYLFILLEPYISPLLFSYRLAILIAILGSVMWLGLWSPQVQRALVRPLFNLLMILNKYINSPAQSVTTIVVFLVRGGEDLLAQMEALYLDGGEVPSDTYKYKPISQARAIRLLRVDSRIPFRKPKYRLEEHSLAKLPKFEAVSYTWEDQHETESIAVDGKCLRVTPNVFGYLLASGTFIGSLMNTRYLWIDAVCINQSDTIEKSKQVALMHDIYSQASLVVVWLPAMLPVRDLSSVRHVITMLAEGLVSGADDLTGLRMDYISREQLNAVFGALHVFFSHRWFTRVWIIQEVAMGASVEVRYGRCRWDWDIVRRAAQNILDDVTLYQRVQSCVGCDSSDGNDDDENAAGVAVTKKPHSAHLNNISYLAAVREQVKKKEKLSLIQYLMLTCDFEATDLRDKVYALLGMVAEGDNLISPDYSKDMTPSKLFWLTATILLNSGAWPLLLHFSGNGYDTMGPESPLADIPSWVPQWDHDKLVGNRVLTLSTLPNAPLGQVALSPDHRAIQVESCLFDTLLYVGSASRVFGSNSTLAAKNARIRGWYLRSRELARNFSEAGTRSRDAADEEFWRVCMSTSENQDLNYLRRARTNFEKIYLNTRPGGWTDSEIEELDVLSLPDMVEGGYMRTITGKAFAITTSGTMTLVPPKTKEGDLLCYIRGTCFPFIIRPRGNGAYELTGSAYAHGKDDIATEAQWRNIYLV